MPNYPADPNKRPPRFVHPDQSRTWPKYTEGSPYYNVDLDHYGGRVASGPCAGPGPKGQGCTARLSVLASPSTPYMSPEGKAGRACVQCSMSVASGEGAGVTANPSGTDEMVMGLRSWLDERRGKGGGR